MTAGLRCLALALALATPGLAEATPPLVQPLPALAAKPPTAETHAAVAAFRKLCAMGDFSAQAIMARADAAGWRKGGSDAPKDFDPAYQRLSPEGEVPMLVRASTEVNGGERHDICAVSIAVWTPGLLGATADWLSLTPNIALGASGTFFLLRNEETWTSGATLAGPAFQKAKAAGSFYSIAVGDLGPKARTDGGWPGMLMLMRAQSLPRVEATHQVPP